MGMGKENKINLFRTDSDLFHVGKQDLPVSSCIEEDGFFKAFDEAGKTPILIELFVKRIVIVDYSNLDGLSIFQFVQRLNPFGTLLRLNREEFRSALFRRSRLNLLQKNFPL